MRGQLDGGGILGWISRSSRIDGPGFGSDHYTGYYYNPYNNYIYAIDPYWTYSTYLMDFNNLPEDPSNPSNPHNFEALMIKK